VHPAYSVIFFTVASGTGYGMLFLMTILALVGRLPLDPWFAWPSFVIAFGLFTAGLLSSLLHLGHPERFLKALTQWRSSWLSREGVLAIATYGPAGLFALGWLFVVSDAGAPGALMLVLAAITALLCIATVFSTSMIYASLKPIPQWFRGDVPRGYLVLALATGALMVHAVGALTGATTHLVPTVALVGLVLALFAKLAYWRGIRNQGPSATAASAIGMDAGVRVRPLDAPHTEPNYLQKEMAYRVARKHADKLRRFALLAGFGIPIVALLAGFGADGALGAVLAVLAVASAHAGIAVERWLFFAEATHTVTLYYGDDQV
jgi:sulfite dehydrogenase (quinone) subunit SoeC